MENASPPPFKRLRISPPDSPETDKPDDFMKICIKRSEFTEKHRLKLSTNEEYRQSLEKVAAMIGKLCDAYSRHVPLMVSIHALVMSQVIISLTKIGFADFQSDFWVYVSMMCFKLSASFHGPMDVLVSDMLGILGFSYSVENKEIYKKVERVYLKLTNWSLFFPTPVNFCDCIKEKNVELDTPLGHIMSTCCTDEAVHGVLCFCLSKWDMLQYSFNSIAISAIATILRLKSVESEGYPDDGIIENIMGCDSTTEGVQDCAKSVFYLVKGKIAANDKSKAKSD
jgi:hypothetical protein